MIKTINQNQSFQTYDISLASFLIYAGFKLTKLDRFNPKKILFCFEHKEGIGQIVEEYFSGNCQVDPLEFFNTLKNLKNRIYTN